MNTTLRQLALLVGKDLRIEARNRHTIGLVVILGVLIIVVLGLGVGQQQAGPDGATATSILWVAYLFGGVLCFEKTMAMEREDGALAGLLLAPMDRATLYAAKLISNLLLMLLLAAVVTPVGVLLLRFDISGALASFVLITALGMLGFAAVGTLFAAAMSSTRLRGGLLALLVFPVCLPLLITSTQMMMRALEPGGGFSGVGVAVLVAFDVIYLAVSWVVFELLLEP
ncbi:MAG: heme exporter protein CcmB [bacterium]